MGVKRFIPPESPRAREDSGMTCQSCFYFESSEKAAQRAVLEGSGYCKVAPTLEQRARFFRADSECWLVPMRFRLAPPKEVLNGQ